MPTGEAKDICGPPDEFAQLCDFIRNQPFLELVKTTCESGCRPQESLRVEAGHVDLKNSLWVFPPFESQGQEGTSRRLPQRSFAYQDPSTLARVHRHLSHNPEHMLE